jgi:hypothetical protein
VVQGVHLSRYQKVFDTILGLVSLRKCQELIDTYLDGQRRGWPALLLRRGACGGDGMGSAYVDPAADTWYNTPAVSFRHEAGPWREGPASFTLLHPLS